MCIARDPEPRQPLDDKYRYGKSLIVVDPVGKVVFDLQYQDHDGAEYQENHRKIEIAFFDTSGIV
ncbi:hypothetical protein D3C81_1566950 [compost metagenome]